MKSSRRQFLASSAAIAAGTVGIPTLACSASSSDDRSGESAAGKCQMIRFVDGMPNMPTPFVMRDWQKVTRDFLDFALDAERQGPWLPLVRFPAEGKKRFILALTSGGGARKPSPAWVLSSAARSWGSR